MSQRLTLLLPLLLLVPARAGYGAVDCSCYSAMAGGCTVSSNLGDDCAVSARATDCFISVCDAPGPTCSAAAGYAVADCGTAR